MFWVFAAIVCVFLPRGVFSLFTTEDAVLDLAPMYMGIQIVMYLGFALMSTPLGFINGIGYVNLNLIIAIMDGVVARIGLSLLFAKLFDIGPAAYWWGSALAGFVSVLWGWLYFFSGKWHDRKLLAGE
jgi:Na+-driven multidrug efflux pump